MGEVINFPKIRSRNINKFLSDAIYVLTEDGVINERHAIQLLKQLKQSTGEWKPMQPEYCPKSK